MVYIQSDCGNNTPVVGGLAEGGIVGDVNEKGWDATSPAAWTSKSEKDGVGTYEFKFIAKKDSVEWKVLIKKGADKNDYS